MSEDAYDALFGFAAAHGITVTALLESMGQFMAERENVTSKQFVAGAKRITEEHKSRRQQRE